MQIVAGLGVYWRTRDVLQIGLDPRVGVLVEGLSRPEQEIVTFLTRSRTPAEINSMAALRGVSEERISAILALLHRSGVLEGLALPTPTDIDAAPAQRNSLPTVRTNSVSRVLAHHHVHITRLDALGRRSACALPNSAWEPSLFLIRQRCNRQITRCYGPVGTGWHASRR